MNRRRNIALGLTLIALSIGISANSVSAHAPEPARKGTRLATQSELRTAFPQASPRQLEDLGKVVVSHYAKCAYPSWYAEEISIRTALAGAHTSGTKWDIKGCTLYYEGPELTCIIVEKDEVLYSMDRDRTFETGSKFCGYQLMIRRLTSKPGYYSLERVPTVKPEDVANYFGGDKGFWSFAPHTNTACYEGPYRLFIIPGGGWMPLAYDARWTKKNILGARNFCVRRTMTLFGFLAAANRKYAN